MFSDCSGECCICSSSGFCVAGHGDDFYSPASPERVIENLNNGNYSQYKDIMIQYLKERGIEYDPNNFGSKRAETTKSGLEYPQEESFVGYTYKIIVRGNCVSCGKEITSGNNIFLCPDCLKNNRAK
jgi:hypothetical protein